MDTKKAIQTLIKIAENQQKVINKLAQQAGGDLHATPPTHIDPAKTVKDSASVFRAAIPQGMVTDVKADDNAGSMIVTFAPGKMTQQNYDTLLGILQKLTNENKIQRQYSLHATTA